MGCLRLQLAAAPQRQRHHGAAAKLSGQQLVALAESRGNERQSVSQSVLLLKVELNCSEEIFNLAQPAAVLVLVVQPELSV